MPLNKIVSTIATLSDNVLELSEGTIGRIVNEAEHPVGINRLGEIENIKFDIDKKLIYNINNKKQLKGVFNYVIQTF